MASRVFPACCFRNLSSRTYHVYAMRRIRRVLYIPARAHKEEDDNRKSLAHRKKIIGEKFCWEKKMGNNEIMDMYRTTMLIPPGLFECHVFPPFSTDNNNIFDEEKRNKFGQLIDASF